MSVHGAAQVKCAVCDDAVSLEAARQDWWICTSCGSYLCPRCYTLFTRSGDDICPGTIVRGAEPHPPHLTRFLAPRTNPEPPTHQGESSVVILEDIPRRPPPRTGGRVIILGDREPKEEEHETQQVDEEDAS
ncbi:MAG: hypothetical protein ACFFCO_04700 [Promethearchaeota archaeon]